MNNSNIDTGEINLQHVINSYKRDIRGYSSYYRFVNRCNDKSLSNKKIIIICQSEVDRWLEFHGFDDIDSTNNFINSNKSTLTFINFVNISDWI
jgi:hypothetical protein